MYMDDYKCVTSTLRAGPHTSVRQSREHDDKVCPI